MFQCNPTVHEEDMLYDEFRDGHGGSHLGYQTNYGLTTDVTDHNMLDCTIMAVLALDLI